MDTPMSDLHFRGMAWLFSLRDFFSPRTPILQEAGLRPGQQVLDFGCGPGSYTLLAARLVGEQGKVYALDIQPLAVARLDRLARSRRLVQIQTIRSAGPTGLPAASIDVALLYDVLHMFNQPQRILAELRRALKPGGLLSVSDHHLKDEHIVAEVTRSGFFIPMQKGRYTLPFRPNPAAP